MIGFRKWGISLVTVLLATFGLNVCGQGYQTQGNSKIKSSPDKKEAGKRSGKEKPATEKKRIQLEKKTREWASGSR